MAKKKARSKSRASTTRRRASESAMPESRTPWWAIVVSVLLFALLIAGIGYELTRDRTPKEATVPGDAVLATVNGQPITQSRLDFHYQLLPERYRDSLSREDVLEELIAEELIIQAAAKEGMEASPEDIHARVQGILAQSDLTPAELEENLAGFNVTTEQFEGLIERQILLERYRTEHLSAAPEPTQEEIAARYEQNIAEYAVPERVSARHVLIRAERESAALTAKAVYDDISAGADICAYVTNSSDDLGSKGTCGEYTFARGAMVPEFEDAAFSMEDGDLRLIQTQYGYHIMTRIGLAPARTLTIDEAREGIVAQLRGEKTSLMYRELVTNLRADATIEYPSAPVPSATAAVIGPAEPTQEESPANMVVETPIVPEEPVAPEEPLVVPQEPVVQAQEPVVAPQEQPPASSDVAAVLSCVARDATLYGTQWSSDTRAARELFSDAGVSLTYVACDDGACGDAGVGAYPTWVIDGQRYVGRLTLEQLRRAADC